MLKEALTFIAINITEKLHEKIRRATCNMNERAFFT